MKQSHASHPFELSPSASRHPLAHVTSHTPALQNAVAFMPAVHAFPQNPQCAVELDKLVSQPLPSTLSQSSKPLLHMYEQTPVAQPTDAFATDVQRFPHDPQ